MFGQLEESLFRAGDGVGAEGAGSVELPLHHPDVVVDAVLVDDVHLDQYLLLDLGQPVQVQLELVPVELVLV